MHPSRWTAVLVAVMFLGILPVPARAQESGTDRYMRFWTRWIWQTPEGRELSRLLDTVPPDEISDRAFALTSRGLARLSGAEQLARLNILSQVYRAVEPEECARLVMEGYSTDRRHLLGVIGQLDSASVATWTALAGRAMLSEWRNDPPPVAGSMRALEDGFVEIFAVLSPLEAPKFARIADDLESGRASDREVCWWGEMLNRALGRMPKRRGGEIARLIVWASLADRQP